MTATSLHTVDKTTTATQPRVLVIDDSRVMRKAINKILDAEYDLVEADDGEEGWQALERDNRVQVIIADVEMPRLDGYSLICRIRANDEPRIRDIPVIVITGAQDDETRERAFACGASDFITKPIDAVQLKARVRAHARFDQTARTLADTQAALLDQAILDPLTQICSKRYFLQRGAQDIAYARRHEDNLCLLRINIDNFRGIYRDYGDEFTDQMLVWTSKILAIHCRTEDTVARIGGAEFAIITPGSGHAEATVLCNRILKAVTSPPFTSNGISIQVTVSIGVVNLGHEKEETIEDLNRIAEQCLIYAKSDGGNRAKMELRKEAPGRLRMQKPEEIVIENAPVSSEQEEVEPAASPWATQVKPEQAREDQTGIHPFDLDTALKMLNEKEYGKLEPQLPVLFTRIIPLLQFGNTRLALGLGFAIEALKEKLSRLEE